MSLPEPSRATLLRLARGSIRHGLEHGAPLRVDVSDLPEELRRNGASFVTLETSGRLRGCIGTLEAHRALAVDAAENAYAAAFDDPRFPPLRPDEEAQLDIHVSVLSAPEPLPCRDEADLVAKLRPGVDGLVLQEGRRRATYLPSVWSDLPDPHMFLAHLRLKAGLAADHWSDTIRFWRYETEVVKEKERIE